MNDPLNTNTRKGYAKPEVAETYDLQTGRRMYEKPKVVEELELETRAGSPHCDEPDPANPLRPQC